MNFDFYIFDLDGTLLDLGNIKVHADKILLDTLKKLNLTELPSKATRNELWLSGGAFQEVLNKWGLSDSINFWKYYDRIDFETRKILLKHNQIKLYQEVEDILKFIYSHKENKKLAVCTNTANYIVKYFLKHFKIYQYFHEIFSMGNNDQDYAKPSPKGILRILNKLGFNPQNNSAIMIGDSIHDVIAAKKAKISSCLINHHSFKDDSWYKQWKSQPNYVIKNLKELLDL
ncbi:MAG: HAD family hydrolase [Candidatus Thorarchaeota archaeon]